MEALLVGAAIALAILFGRQGAEELVVLVPAADGHIGTVVIDRGGKKTTLNTAYAASRAMGAEEGACSTLAADDVQRQLGATLSAIPSRPASFLLYFVTGTDELT